MSHPSIPSVYGVAPILKVADPVRTAAFYRDALGFELDFTYGEPPVLISVTRGRAQVFLSHFEGPRQFSEDSGSDVYFMVEHVDSLYAEFAARRLELLSEPTEYGYGMKDFEVRDCNGYVLCFGQAVS